MIVKVTVTQTCLTLCNPMGYTVHGILQARVLEWVALPFSRDLPNPGIEPKSPTLQADSLPAEPAGKPSIDGTKSKIVGVATRPFRPLSNIVFHALCTVCLEIPPRGVR